MMEKFSDSAELRLDFELVHTFTEQVKSNMILHFTNSLKEHDWIFESYVV